MFVLYLDKSHPDQNLNILCFDQDDAEVDDPLGSIDIDLNLLTDDETYEQTCKLEGVESGLIILSLRRVPLMTPHQAQVSNCCFCDLSPFCLLCVVLWLLSWFVFFLCIVLLSFAVLKKNAIMFTGGERGERAQASRHRGRFRRPRHVH
jgi:hypothetical protein